MKPLFQVNIWQLDDGNYIVDTISVEDNKVNRGTGTKLGALLKKVASRISKRNQHNRKFPLPEPGVIIKPNGNGAPRLIVPAHN